MPQHDIYFQGSLVLVTATFRDTNEALADPTNVIFAFRRHDGGGALTTYVYGTDVELVRDSLGVFQVELNTDTPGHYHYRWEGTGVVDVVGEDSFTIRPSGVV